MKKYVFLLTGGTIFEAEANTPEQAFESRYSAAGHNVIQKSFIFSQSHGWRGVIAYENFGD